MDSNRDRNKQIKKRPSKKPAKSERKKGLITGFVIMAAIIAVVILVTPYFVGGSARAAVIHIPKNATEENVKDTLTKYFGKGYSARAMTVFNVLAKDPAKRYGGYDIAEGTTPAAAARKLARGTQSTVKITINGVREFSPFINRIAAKFDFPADSLRTLLADSSTMAKYGLTPEQSPSLFFNDTYYLYWTSTARELLEKVGTNYQKFWNKERRAKADSLGLTPAEVMTLASIVDEETNQLSEKGRIGRLYINRLKKNMRLQADPTVRFALKDFTIKRVTSRHTTSAPAPYNTYRVAGLPPGPIRTTSTATIEAILNSSPTDDLYMCAREDFSGFHNFAATYEEHQKNARAYQNALNERGIH